MRLPSHRSVKLLAFLLSCLLVYACENKLADIKQLSDHRTSVDQGIEIESFLSQAGKMKARLTAPLMKRFQTDSPYTEFPNRLHVDFYNDSEKLKASFLPTTASTVKTSTLFS